MTKEKNTAAANITRGQMIELLNEDLAGEYQAIIAYTVYSQVLKGAAYTDIARELESPPRNCSTPSRLPSRLIISAGCRA